MTALPIIDQSAAIRVKIFNKIADASAVCRCVARVTYVLGIKPIQQFAQSTKTGFRTAM